MLGAHGDLHRVVRIAADPLNIRKGGAGDHEAAILHPGVLQLLAALGQAVAVHGNQGQLLILHLKEGTGVDGAHVVIRHGEDGLVDHAAQDLLGQGYGIEHVHHRHFRIVLRADAHEVIFALSALYLDAVVIVHGNGHDPVGHTADHLAEETGADHDGAGLDHVRLQIGIDPFFQVVAGDLHVVLGFDQQPFQRGNGALGRRRAGGNGAGRLQQTLFTGKFHILSS